MSLPLRTAGGMRQLEHARATHIAADQAHPSGPSFKRRMMCSLHDEHAISTPGLAAFCGTLYETAPTMQTRLRKGW